MHNYFYDTRNTLPFQIPRDWFSLIMDQVGPKHVAGKMLTGRGYSPINVRLFIRVVQKLHGHVQRCKFSLYRCPMLWSQHVGNITYHTFSKELVIASFDCFTIHCILQLSYLQLHYIQNPRYILQYTAVPSYENNVLVTSSSKTQQ